MKLNEMNKPERPLSHRIAFWCLFACAVFMTCVSFLGFLGWSGDPSNQKWAALGCSVFGAAATFVLWKSKDMDTQAYVGNADDEIKAKPVEQQQQYWKKEIRGSVIGGVVGAGAFWVLSLFFKEFKPPSIYFWWAYIWLMAAWRIFRSVRELAKLRRL